MSRQDDIKKLIMTHNRRLQILNEQRALQGISVEPKVIMEIENITVEIEELQTELEELEKQSLKERVVELEAINKSLNNLLTQLSQTAQSSDHITSMVTNESLGKGIRMGGLYRNTPLRIVATDWAKYGTGWVKSGWLYIPERTHNHAVAFFKVHALDDKTGYIHILDSANPTHVIWLETNTGFRAEQTFCWDEYKDALRTALWQFTWQ